MYELKRTIRNLEHRDEARIRRIFLKHVGFGTEGIPPRLQATVESARSMAYEQFRITALYETAAIAERRGNTITTATGQSFASPVLARVLSQAEGFVAIAVTLTGAAEAIEAADTMTEKLYLDGWATGLLESAAVDLRQELKSRIEATGLFTTITWSPGQYGFEINNQLPLFDLLHPEEIGITLNENLLMIPEKSVSQMFGICREEPSDQPAPCDYCMKSASCGNAWSDLVYRDDTH